MSKVQSLINNLQALYPIGIDLSLHRLTALLEKLGNPHERLPPVIHIAGTNGKGSASATCRALLEAKGLSVHVHTSPHLVRWQERYRLGATGGGRLVEDDVLIEAITTVIKTNNNDPITVFEALSAVGFLLFAEHPADALILEVGLGGRFDATNVIKQPACALIMPISFDHTNFLGETIEKIAFEKGGIIKSKSPVVIGRQEFAPTLEILSDIAQQNNAPLSVFGSTYQAYQKQERLVFQDQNRLWKLPLPKLQGAHQIDNAGAALMAVQAAGFSLSQDEAAQGLIKIDWPARLQPFEEGALRGILPPPSALWLDGGHNPAGARVLAAQLQMWRQENPRPVVAVIGMIDTKDSNTYLHTLKPAVDYIYTVPVPDQEKAIPPQELALSAQKAGISALAQPNIKVALSKIAYNHPDAWVLITGSLYLAGAVLDENGTPPS